MPVPDEEFGRWSGEWAPIREARLLDGAPGGIRTPDPVVRSHMLWSTELRARGCEGYPQKESRREGRPPGGCDRYGRGSAEGYSQSAGTAKDSTILKSSPCLPFA